VAVPICYESLQAIVYDKPAGMATHPTLNHADGTLANVYAARCMQRGIAAQFHPVTRLDKNTSGLVLAAKDRYATPLLAGSVQKEYVALCEGVLQPNEGEIDAPIARKAGSIIGRCVNAAGAPSVTRFVVEERFETHTLLRVKTLTGRTHQIRVHLSHIGHPLAGDTLYGGHQTLIDRHALHCDKIRFTEPTNPNMVSLQCSLPQDMDHAIKALSKREKGE
jgi:23S rRNA pseudouridine1911/1915/1917 synthase